MKINKIADFLYEQNLPLENWVDFLNFIKINFF